MGPNNGNFLNMPLSVLICIKVYSFYLLQWNYLYHNCCCSVTKSCPTLCDPMNCSTPGFPVLRYLLEFAQTNVHRVSDAIQPSHPLLSPLLSPSVFPSIRVFSSESALHIRWPKNWSFRFSISPSSEFPLGWTGLTSCIVITKYHTTIVIHVCCLCPR